MAPPSDLVVLICHGGFLTPQPYKPFIEALKVKGIEAHCPQLATSDITKFNVGDVNSPDYDREPPEAGIPQGENDVEIVLDVLRLLVGEKGKRVLILAYSASGWTATEASRPEWQAEARKAQGRKGGIVGILYTTAFVIPVGESIHTFFQPKDGTFFIPPWMNFHAKQELGTLNEPEKYLFSDLEEAEARKLAAGLTAGPLLTTVLENDAYAALPCAYLVTEGDAIIPKEHQEGMAAAQSHKTGAFTTYRCSAGHFPFLSWKEGLVDVVQGFAKKIEAGN
ncbi:Alpha/beta hydrolase fold-1 [Xylariaceae sp. FL0016]|nr:Alpha/beta hydrolase fold-1 [Xylariaceae sp. FL0016]